jgi:hypothetical protein
VAPTRIEPVSGIALPESSSPAFLSPLPAATQTTTPAAIAVRMAALTDGTCS